MELETYQRILKDKGLKHDNYSTKRRLKEDIAGGKVVWTGGFGSDLWTYYKNTHSLLGVWVDIVEVVV